MYRDGLFALAPINVCHGCTDPDEYESGFWKLELGIAAGLFFPIESPPEQGYVLPKAGRRSACAKVSFSPKWVMQNCV